MRGTRSYAGTPSTEAGPTRWRARCRTNWVLPASTANAVSLSAHSHASWRLLAAAVVIAMLLTMSSSYDVMLWQPSMRLGASWITVKVQLTQGKATAFFPWHTFCALGKNVCGGSHEFHHLAARSQIMVFGSWYPGCWLRFCCWLLSRDEFLGSQNLLSGCSSKLPQR